MVVNPLHLLKACWEMPVTELGISMLVSPLQLRKAQKAIVVTVLGMVLFWQPVIKVLVAVSMSALQLSRES